MQYENNKGPPLNYPVILQSIPDLYLVLNPQLIVVEVSNAYLSAMNFKREELLGRSIFELIADHDSLKISLESVLRQKIPQTCRWQKYSVNSHVKEYRWNWTNIPILDQKDNEILYIIHRIECVPTSHEQHVLESELREAFQHNRFILHYQPQMHLKTGKVYGVEALVRMVKQNGDLLMPSDFISVAEDSGLIIQMGEWVLETACVHHQLWDNKIMLAVNFSARQLTDERFLEMVERVLEKTKFPASLLEFEITENPIISDIATSANIFEQLRELGIRISLDDFGVGYSSLNYLRQFQIDTLKIDQALFQQASSQTMDFEMIAAIIKMAHAMQILVIAEGVVTREQIQFLIEHQCDVVQSNYYSEPLPHETVIDWIKSYLQDEKQ